ncbi:MAG TPA: hypothetical protein VMV69_05980 [Pirellulales bacterium]|nr:hypothetical protein [Pirellulales bacterium]
MSQEVIPVLVAFHTARWIKVALRSYHRHFPHDRVVVVDNNPRPGEPGWEPACDTERDWLRSCSDVTLLSNDGPDKRHGAGIDVALDHCRTIGAEIMLHFEPDCLVTGSDWYEELWRPLNGGAWMAGNHCKLYGPIHPTPSMWRIDRVAGSFVDRPRGADADHPRFAELFDLARLLDHVRVEAPQLESWWRENWDTGQHNWFHAAAAGRAALAKTTGDFHHYWRGSMLPEHPALTNDPRVVELNA